MKEKVVKAKDLIPGKKYWCGWASRFAVYVKKHEYTWADEKITEYVFQDVVGCHITCGEAAVEYWVKEA